MNNSFALRYLLDICQYTDFPIKYLSRYGSPLTVKKERAPENRGQTRRRAIRCTSDTPIGIKRDNLWKTTYIIDKWDHTQIPAT